VLTRLLKGSDQNFEGSKGGDLHWITSQVLWLSYLWNKDYHLNLEVGHEFEKQYLELAVFPLAWAFVTNSYYCSYHQFLIQTTRSSILF